MKRTIGLIAIFALMTVVLLVTQVQPISASALAETTATSTAQPTVTKTPAPTATATEAPAYYNVAKEAKLLQWFYRSQSFVATLKANVAWGYGIIEYNETIIQQKQDQGEDTEGLRAKVNDFRAALQTFERNIEVYEIALARHNGYGYAKDKSFIVTDRLEAQNMILTEVLLPVKKDLTEFKRVLKIFYKPIQ